MDWLRRRIAARYPSLQLDVVSATARAVASSFLAPSSGGGPGGASLSVVEWEAGVRQAAGCQDDVLQQRVEQGFQELTEAYLEGEELEPFVASSSVVRVRATGEIVWSGRQANFPENGSPVAVHPGGSSAQVVRIIGSSANGPAELASEPQLFSTVCMHLAGKGKLLSEEPKPADISMPSTYSVPFQPVAKPVPPWMRQLRRSPEHNEFLLKYIQQGWKDLLADKGDVVIEGHLDFGIKRCVANWTGGFGERESKVPSYFRSLLIKNHRRSEVVLLDVRAVPSLEESFVVHMDHSFPLQPQAGRNNFDAEKEPTMGLVMPSGSECQITVVGPPLLMHPSVEYPSRKSCRASWSVQQGMPKLFAQARTLPAPSGCLLAGILTQELRCVPQAPVQLQHWLLLTFSATVDNGTHFVIGRRLSALIAKNEHDMHQCLRQHDVDVSVDRWIDLFVGNSSEAKPFYPPSLRTIFDAKPEILFVGQRPPSLPWMQDQDKTPLPACSHSGFTSVLREGRPPPAERPPPVEPAAHPFPAHQYPIHSPSPSLPFPHMPAMSMFPTWEPYGGQLIPGQPWHATPITSFQLLPGPGAFGPLLAHPPIYPGLPLLPAPMLHQPTANVVIRAPSENGIQKPWPAVEKTCAAAQPEAQKFSSSNAIPAAPVASASEPTVVCSLQLEASSKLGRAKGVASAQERLQRKMGKTAKKKAAKSSKVPEVQQQKRPLGVSLAAFPALARPEPLTTNQGEMEHISQRVPHSSSVPDRCPCVKKQLIQLLRLLALEEATMEHDIKNYDLYNTRLEVSNLHDVQTPWLFSLQVAGLAENRPAVMKDDVVYLRSAGRQGIECAAPVHYIEMRQPSRLHLAVAPEFIAAVAGVQTGISADKLQYLVPKFVGEQFHARFTFDRLPLRRMHAAIMAANHRPAPRLLPCLCSASGTLLAGVLLPHTLDDPVIVEPSQPAAVEASLQLINTKLNAEQQRAVFSMLEKPDGGMLLIHGPPGTGKTMTLVETVLQLLQRFPSARLLVCAPANYAADLLCSGIADGGVSPQQMWRLNDPRRMVASVKDDVIGVKGGPARNFCCLNEELQIFDLHPNPGQLRVVVSTCVTAGILHEVTMSLAFSHILIDEAGQALIPETLVPLTLASEHTRLLLCGDPLQLGPVVHSSLAATRGLARSLLEVYMSVPAYRQDEQAAWRPSGPITKLVHNYRSHSQLLALPSKMFYAGELVAASPPETVAPPSSWEELGNSTFPILFYGVKGQQMNEGSSPSYFNPVEATRLVELLDGLLRHCPVTEGDIGVIAPYRNQVHKLRLLLRNRDRGAVRVGTVDDYQGQEAKIVFISTVVTLPQSQRRSGTSGSATHIGLLGNPKRFNVAITRAKALLVVVGHPVVLGEDPCWRELLKYCVARDAYRGAGSHALPRFVPGMGTADWAESALQSAVRHGGADTEVGADWDAGSGMLETDHEDEEIERTIERMAELSLLGMGDVDRLYPESTGDMYSAYSDEPEWRVLR